MPKMNINELLDGVDIAKLKEEQNEDQEAEDFASLDINSSVDEKIENSTNSINLSKNSTPRINIEQLLASPFNCFPEYTGERMENLVESIKKNGVLQPIIIRDRPGSPGMFEIVAGHNRTKGSKIAGFDTIPYIYKDLNDDEAKFIVLDSNLQQRGLDDLKPSEKAEIIYQRYEEINTEKLNAEIKESTKNDSGKTAGEEYSLSRATIYRYLQFYKCIQGIKDRVDDHEISFITALDLSNISEENQNIIEMTIQDGEVKLSKKMSAMLKEDNENNKLNEVRIIEILSGKSKEIKKTGEKDTNKKMNIKISNECYQKYFSDIEKKEIENIVETALQLYFDN